ncbi:MAG: carboxypeptidase-like regulatory domain-containing protein, partial [Bacteroidaceae bacterium]|nr:carboxypeptidase-like regulatory domain-containing protein [Bacteroidaceae bacterium]
MRKSILVILCVFTVVLAKAQTISGRIVDEQAQPMAFANVVLLNRSDSAFVQGVVTKDDGTFSIQTDRQDGLLRISSVGYII